MKHTYSFEKVSATQDYYANWASGGATPKTSIMLTVTDNKGVKLWSGKLNKTPYNNVSVMKSDLKNQAKMALR
jgi:hypothetical protein